MSDQREPFGKRRKSGESRSARADRADTGKELSAQPDSSPSREEASVKVVSSALASRKDKFHETLSKPPIALPELSKALGEMTRQQATRSTTESAVDMKTTLESPPHKLLGPPEADRPVAEQSLPDENAPLDPLAGNQPAVPASHGTHPAIASHEPAKSLTAHALTGAKGDRPEALDTSRRGETPAPSKTIPISRSIESSLPIESPRTGDRPVASGSAGDASHSPSRGANGSRDESAPSVAANMGIASRDQFSIPGAPNPARNSGTAGPSVPKETNPTSRFDDPSSPARAINGSPKSVRNPLSSDLRSSLMDVPGGTGGAAVASDTATSAFGSAEGTAGPSASTPESGAIDLSRTNELLQQLLDAFRKQRSSSLSIGGPAVYADR